MTSCQSYRKSLECCEVLSTDSIVDVDQRTEWAKRTTCPERSEGQVPQSPTPSTGENLVLTLDCHCKKYSKCIYFINDVKEVQCCTVGTERRIDVALWHSTASMDFNCVNTRLSSCTIRAFWAHRFAVVV